MKHLLTTTILTALAIAPALARPSSSSSFSRSYSRPSSSYNYSASRSSSYYSAPRTTYQAPRSTYVAPRSYSSTTVVNNHTHTSSGGGFGSSFLGGMAGAAVGNALTQPHGYGYVPPPVAPTVASPGATGYDFDAPAPVMPVEAAYHDPSPIWPWLVVPFGILGVAAAVVFFRKKSVHTKPRRGVIGTIMAHKPLYRSNPGLIPGVEVDVPAYLGEDTGRLSFVMDNVGKQRATAIGHNDAFAHLYLGGEIDEDFVRVFVSSATGGPAREAWAFSNVATLHGADWVVLTDSSVGVGGNMWSARSPDVYGTEIIRGGDGNDVERNYRERLYGRPITNGKTEYLLIRTIYESDGARYQRVFAGVEIPPNAIS